MKALFDRDILYALLRGSYTPRDIKEFSRLCYALALPVIKRRTYGGRMNPLLVGLSESDIAFDCIADLFQRDEEGHFSELVRYFENHPTDDDEELYIALRGLVFKHVDQSLVRIYGEIDSSFGRILRNLRNAIRSSRYFVEVIRFGEQHIVPSGVDPLLHAPPCPIEILRQQFSNVALVYDNAPILVKKLHTILVQQDEYQRCVPFLSVAYLCRELQQLSVDTREAEVSQTVNDIDLPVLHQAIEDTCKRLFQEMRPSYVGKGKCHLEEFVSYVKTIESILKARLSNGTPHQSNYHFLKQEMIGLTRTEYAERHRTILEYLTRLAKKQLSNEIKNL